MVSKTNLVGASQNEYKGASTTLCSGCGHNSVTNHLIKALYDSSIDPYSLAKMSGIGCSSKTPAYFAQLSHGFNSVHGRMAAVALGAQLGNTSLSVIGVSGDGDTASIGLGQFCHTVRRNVDMVYIIENNGVYGLTKGQFSATADEGAQLKSGAINELSMMDCCALAIQLGGTFVARSFSGDRKQVVPLLQAALAHRGIAVIDIISPCVTFNNHPGSTKSYDWVKDHLEPLQSMDYFMPQEEITADYAEGETFSLDLPDGGRLMLKKLTPEYDPTDRAKALGTIAEHYQRGLTLTGLLYVDPKSVPYHQREKVTDTPLYRLTEKELRPSREALNAIMERMKI